MQSTDVVRLEISPVQRVARKFEIKDTITALDEKQIYAHVSRVWRRHLSPNELSVMLYIIDRTVGWGKQSFRASHDNIINGTEQYAGIGLPRRTYLKVLADLETKGIIVRIREQKCVKIIPNLTWKADEMAIPTPKRLQNKTEKCRSGTEEVHDLHPEYEQYGTLAVSSINPPSPDFRAEGGMEKEKGSGEENCNRVQNLLAERQAKLSSDRKTKVSDAKEKRTPTASDIEDIWSQALRETFPEQAHVSWTIKQKGIINKFAKKWVHSNTFTLGEAVDWAVRNWPQIIKAEFHWMTKDPAPMVPSWRFFQSFSDRFVNCYTSDSIRRRFVQGKGSRAEEMRLKGMSEQEALMTAAREEAIQATRNDAGKKLEEAKRLNRQAEDKLNRAGKINTIREKLGLREDETVPHPTSPNGKKLIEEERSKNRQDRPKSSMTYNLPDVWKRDA